MEVYPLIIFIMSIGAALIYGAYKKWQWLVNPSTDEWWSMFYSQVAVKKIVGKKGTIIFTYILGLAFIGIGALYFTQNLWR
jgi:hypothetical protein